MGSGVRVFPINVIIKKKKRIEIPSVIDYNKKVEIISKKQMTMSTTRKNKNIFLIINVIHYIYNILNINVIMIKSVFLVFIF